MTAAAAGTHSSMASDAEKKEQALTEYRSKLQKHKEIDTKVRALREAVKELKKEYDKTEDDLKALQVRPGAVGRQTGAAVCGGWLVVWWPAVPPHGMAPDMQQVPG